MRCLRRKSLSQVLLAGVAVLAWISVIIFAPTCADASPRKSRSASTSTSLVERESGRHGTMHVFLLRGLFNVFSTGMNEIDDKLKRRGIRSTVDNHSVWSSLADQAIREYKSGRTSVIVIMGHSQGAISAIDMANKIAEAGVPVSLVVTLDPAFRSTVSNSNVRWVVNLYMPAGIGAKVYAPKRYSGRIENKDIGKTWAHHMTLDKSGWVQDLAIGYALKARAAGRPTPARELSASARGKSGVKGEPHRRRSENRN